jgi:hypothetical protein
VGGSTGISEVTEMWKQHYNNVYNSIVDVNSRALLEQRLLEGLDSCSTAYITVRDVVEICSRQQCGKAVGPDGVAMEAFIHGGSRLFVHVSLLFNLFVKVGYIPDSFMHSVFVPLVKSKIGDLSDVNNYRAIAISTSFSKLFENVLSVHVKSVDKFDDYQFGFTPGCSTGICTSVFKRTVDYYTDRGSHVFVAFVDFSKAFDNVNYWKLFNMLLDDKVDTHIVRLVAFWYSNQRVRVRWNNCQSDFFTVGNGTRQWGVLSPWLFNRYIRGLLREVVDSSVGCSVAGLATNILAYADDLVLLAPSWEGLQCLLNILEYNSKDLDMTVNVKKTVCMMFLPKKRSRVVALNFPLFKFDREYLQFVHNFKYLGHWISSGNTDNDDIQREITNMFIRCNTLKRRFSHCSTAVKLLLFKSFCLCLYDVSLWTRFKRETLLKLRSCYIKCVKSFFGYNRRDSVTLMLLDLGLPSFDTLMYNSSVSFHKQCVKCDNHLVRHMVKVLSL